MRGWSTKDERKFEHIKERQRQSGAPDWRAQMSGHR
jgi:hypothetical protein